MIKTTLVALAVCVTGLIGNLLLSSASTELPGVEIPGGEHAVLEPQDPDDIKTAARQAFMQGKLDSNKKIVQGLTTNDFIMIQQGATEVSALIKGQHWFVLDTPQYKNYSEDMNNAAKKLQAAADNRNLEAAALRYFDLTVSCIDCHQYIETTKY